MQKIGVIANPTKVGFDKVINFISKWCMDHAMDVIFSEQLNQFLPDSEKILPNQEMFDTVEGVIVLGGDGTILAVIDQIGNRSLPVLGVNMGHLGFLAETPIEEVELALGRLQRQEFVLDSRMIIEGNVYRHGQLVITVHALNDIVIYRGSFPRLIELDIYINDDFLSTYCADGIIVATPTGSTGYSLSAGGPIVVPHMHAILTTPINAHTLAVRPLIFPDQDAIKICLLSSNEQIVVTTDGHPGISLQYKDEIVITRAAYDAKLIHMGDTSFYSILREKFKLGARITNRQYKQPFNQ